jgi:hypothetical protein
VYLVLELIFQKLPRGFYHERIMIVMVGTQIYALFFLVNTLSLLRVGIERWYPSSLNGVTVSILVLVIFVANYWVIRCHEGFDAYRKIFSRIPRAKKVWSGAAIVMVAIVSVVGCIVTGGMVAQMNQGVLN